ncbi:MAG: hypothetical protein IEMM0002_1240 [bacterium]|nr:MAG: hypothetical protein IEMM0002_1240 [bacterium]
MRLFKIFILVIAVVSATACGNFNSSVGGTSDGTDTGSGTAGSGAGIERLSLDEYAGLSNVQKYQTANKISATLYKGVAVKDFFNLDNGLTDPTLANEENFIAATMTALSGYLANSAAYFSAVDAKYIFDESDYSGFWTQQYPLAVLFEFPISKDRFEIWMAYTLANTILFSPAVERESVDYIDIQHVLYRLVKLIGNGKTISEVVYEHLVSQENWRRFRSPEDNTREMMEIFLARFIDDEVPMAAIACGNWYLADDRRGYQLVIGFDENDAPQNILDTAVTTCYDFYRAVSEHPSLLPRVISILVNVFFAGHSDDEKAGLVNAIIDTAPVTFNDLFTTIIFSREYLLNAERPKSFEEAFFNTARRIDWYAKNSFFRDLNRRLDRTTHETLSDLRQAPITYKLRRQTDVPLDSLSFAFYHKAVRERLLIDRKTDDFNEADGGWQADFIDVNLDGDDFIHYVFLSVISRKAADTELSALNAIFDGLGYGSPARGKTTSSGGALYHGSDGTLDDKMGKAVVIMDYISRLSEFYYFNTIN